MCNSIKDNIRKYSEGGLLILCIITYVTGFFWQIKFLEFITGVIGTAYCIGYLVIVFLKPIKRDWLLAKGNFLAKVINFVLFIPIIVTAFIHVFNYYSPKTGSISCKELVFDENLYTNNNYEIDTLGIIKLNSTSCIPTICHKAAIDSLAITKKTNLQDSIAKKQEDPSLLWTVYYNFIDPGNQHMTTTRRGRIIAGIVATGGFLLLNGLLISMLISWFDRRREQWLKGEVKYCRFLRRRKNKFYTVIGGNDVAIGIVGELLSESNDKDKPYIVIQTSRDVENFRRELFSCLKEWQQKRIIIYYGSRTSKDDVAYLHIENAKEVYIIGEDTRTDDIESHHDTINMKCFELIFEYLKETGKGQEIKSFLDEIGLFKKRFMAFKEKLEASTEEEKEMLKEEKKKLEEEKKNLEKKWDELLLKCHVIFEYQTTFSVFQFFDINEDVDAYIKFRPFNHYEMWAQKVFINKEVLPEEIKKSFNNEGYLPLEGAAGIKEQDDNHVHLFIVGMSRMGIAMAIEAAQLCHYPNFESRKIRTKITFIDKNAAEEKNFFIGRFKELFELSHWRYGSIDESGALVWRPQDIHIPIGFDYLGGDFLDIEWEFINGGIESTSIQDYILKSASPQAKVTIAICLPESNRSHAAALFLDKKIYESDSVLQVLVYNRNGNAIINAISKNNFTHPFCGKLRSFGCLPNQFIVNHLTTCEYLGYEIEKAYNGGEEEGMIKEYDYKGKSKEAMRWSSIYCGNTMWTKLRSIAKTSSINDNDIQLLADVEHNRWNIEELLMNFRHLTPEEQKSVLDGKSTKNQMKSQMAHLDICSNKKLLEIDGKAQRYDKDLTAILGEIYQKIKANTQNSNRQ